MEITEWMAWHKLRKADYDIQAAKDKAKASATGGRKRR